MLPPGITRQAAFTHLPDLLITLSLGRLASEGPRREINLLITNCVLGALHTPSHSILTMTHNVGVITPELLRLSQAKASAQDHSTNGPRP